MKRRLSYILTVVLSMGLLISCNEEVIQDNSYGYLGLKMESDLSEDIIFKSGDSDEMVFSVEVKNASGQSVVNVEDHRTITTENPIKLQIGNYDVIASNGENLNAAFENPYYEGVKNVRIYPDKVNTVDLTCTLANSIFSVEFPEEFAEHFDVYEVYVTNGVGDPLVFSNTPQRGNVNEAGFDAKAYFAVTGTLTWDLYLQNKDYKEGSEAGIYRTTITYNDIKARQHYHLKFNLGADQSADGAFVVKVTLDSTMDESSHELILDFDNRYLPSVTTNDEFAVESNKPVTVPVGNTINKVLNFSTPVGAASVRVEHDNALLADKGLPRTVELIGADVDLSSAGIYVSDQSLSKAAVAGVQNVYVDITDFISRLSVGMYEMEFTIIDAKGHYDVFILAVEIISNVDAEAVAAYIGWACFAKLEGRYFTTDAPEGITFQYKRVSDQEWIEIDPSEMDINTSSLRYTTIISGLAPSTEYVFRAVSAEDKETKEITFSTSIGENIHNLSFDNWYEDGSAWMPNASSDNYVWDSANPGTASMGVVPTTPEESDVVKGKAARLETTTVMGMLAAGNIYVGQFAKVSGVGAELDWGYPFTSRPLALRGYYKYAPKAIDMAKDPYKGLVGTGDQCQIQILLTDWTDRFHINTSKKKFVDFDNDQNIIAHGSLVSGNEDSGYVKFTIPLVYRNDRTPKYIVIVGAASRYGDYFTGGKGSVLKLDEFELVYDPAELTEEEYQQVFSKVSPF